MTVPRIVRMRRAGLARRVVVSAGVVIPAALLLVASSTVAPPLAQQPPDTDIWLLEIGVGEGGAPVITTTDPVNVTKSPGYDNQPHFTPDGTRLLYTSSCEEGQTDIVRYDLDRRTATRLTTTTESEYSPTPTPGHPGIAVVRVEADGRQRLWAFDAGGGNPRLLLPDVEPVGYQAWADPGRVALFVLGEPATLQVADLDTGEARVVARGIGRSLHPVPGRRAVSFLQAETDAAQRSIQTFDLDTDEIVEVATPLLESEDYAWTPDGTLLMARGSIVYRYDAGTAEWLAMVDLESFGITGITRLAVSPDGARLALVAETVPEG